MALFPDSHGRGVSGRWPAAAASASSSSPLTIVVEMPSLGISSRPSKPLSATAAAGIFGDVSSDTDVLTSFPGGVASARRCH